MSTTDNTTDRRTPAEIAREAAIRDLGDALERLHHEGAITVQCITDPAHGFGAETRVRIASLPESVMAAARAMVPDGEHMVGFVKIPSIAEDEAVEMAKPGGRIARMMVERLAVDLLPPYDLTPEEIDLDARAQALTEKLSQWHRDGVLTLAYNADRSEVSSRLPLSVLPESAVGAAREQYPDAIDGDALAGLLRVGDEFREEGLATDETIAPGGDIACLFTRKLARDLAALGL